jgi:hypothetical protein
VCGRGVCVGGGGRAVYYEPKNTRCSRVCGRPLSDKHSVAMTMDAYTTGDSPAGLLDLPAVGLQKLSKLSVCARVQYAEARRKVRPKSKNLQGKEAALTHTNGHTGRASTVL